MYFFNAHTHFQLRPEYEILNAGSDLPQHGWFSAGIHPWDADEQYNLPEMRELLAHRRCVAVGEAGLDKLHGPELPVQEKLFREQVALSEKYQLPLIIHCVKTWAELLAVYKDLDPEQVWIYHGFNKAGILREVLDTEIRISIGASVLTNEALQKVVPLIPDDRLLLETDDSKTDIREVYACISDLKQISLPALQDLVSRNFKQTFARWTNG